MKIKILETSQITTPSIVYSGQHPILKLVIKEIIKYVTVYV